MQKIIIKNFRAIEYAEIELKKILVLIGAQASGKSTIAKLIYFFKTIQDDFFVQVYESGNTDLEKLVRRKFIEFFGLVKMDFEVEFWFDEEKTIVIKGNSANGLEIFIKNIDFENDNLKSIVENIEVQNESFRNTKQRHLRTLGKSLATTIGEIFNQERKDNLYTIAGRNVTVSYSNIFSQYLNTKIQIGLKESNGNDNFQNYDSTDEKLMIDFIQQAEFMKERFNANHTFQGLINYKEDLDVALEKEGKTVKIELGKLILQIEKILKGKYQISNNYERLVLENGKSIPLSDASSGQQEVIRILQDLFLLVLDNRKFFRIIEEPEAHLFPIAQKELIELLALAVNYQRENQLIIATHSPYILSVFNNLLFANEVAAKDESLQGEISEIIDKDFWLKAEDFAAYTLGGEEAYCESIMSEDGGMIDQNYLDEVSEILGMEYYALREIYLKTFKSERR